MENNHVDRKWIERRMAEVGIRFASELARRIGLSDRSLMTNILAGKRQLSEDKLGVMADVLKVPAGELAIRLGGKHSKIAQAFSQNNDTQLLVKGSLDEHFNATVFNDDRKKDHVTVDLKTGTGAFALRYETANTSVAMFDGSVAVMLEKRDIDEAAMLDRNNLVWLADGRILLRRVSKGQLPGRYMLEAANNAPMYDVELTAFAPVHALLIAPK